MCIVYLCMCGITLLQLGVYIGKVRYLVILHGAVMGVYGESRINARLQLSRAPLKRS